MLKSHDAWESWRNSFSWNLPRLFNIGNAITDRWAHEAPERAALVEPLADGTVRTTSFGALAEQSNRLASALRAKGVTRCDRIALLLPQGVETVVVHAASAKLGAIAVPLALLFGEEAIAHRLRGAAPKALFTTAEGWRKARGVAGAVPGLEHVFITDAPDAATTDYHRLLAGGAVDFTPVPTTPDDPALMIFTSGTTGAPKGALHGHRVLLGHLPGVQAFHESMPEPGDLLWTPADWAWAGGLLNVLMPGLALGVPVVVHRQGKFDPEEALETVARLKVRNAFVPPTALRMMRAAGDAVKRARLNLRTIGSAGEALGRDTFDWAEGAFGIPVNEAYGQTECNLVLGSSARLGVSKGGAIGKPIPGHEVAILDGEGRPVPRGQPGRIAVRAPDPVMFLGYWNDEPATREKFLGDWFITGDGGRQDEDGYFHFIGRDDDIITSAGFRIGPSEIEDCLAGHPAVRMAAAVGKPDPLRTEIVKAYVVLKDGVAPSDRLAAEIARFVRERLSAHEYPREVAFVDEVPLTTSGKVIRRHFRERARCEAEISAGEAASSDGCAPA
ncbi:MAG: AMP-binding protein [Methylobacterium mesophilicum]|nr:AMP-binding protein [Methylobacterium mesophilicum]